MGFPGGYTHLTFFAMVASHTFIYLYDHWRVLRSIPKCTFASMDVDWWSQVMLIPCCGLILSCLVFKANCQGCGFCLGDWNVLQAMLAAFVLHCIAHLLLLIY